MKDPQFSSDIIRNVCYLKRLYEIPRMLTQLSTFFFFTIAFVVLAESSS